MSDLVRYDPSADWYAEVPRSISRHVVLGLVLLVLGFGGFGTWALTAPLAAAVISQGSFVATGRNKIVQHLEGGIIEEIFVQEGQFVEKGDPLLSLDQTSAEVNERELHLRKLRLQATSERLLAEYHEEERMAFSTPLREEARRDSELATILDNQKLTFDITRKSLMADIALLERNVDALRIREEGYAAQMKALQRRSEILAEEMASKQELLAKSLISRNEVNALRRIDAEAEAQLVRLQAEFDEVRTMLLKHENQMERARAAYRQTALEELGPISAELESVREKERQAESVLGRAVIRSPVSGTVVRMHYHTSRGVVETGKPIAEILPADAPLIIETQFLRTDIDSVMTGQTASVRLTALNRRTTPVLTGKVFYVSADALAETISGIPQEVYLARISIDPSELARVPSFVATPGMPVEVMIQTRERTFAEYLTKPITDSFSRAFREQ